MNQAPIINNSEDQFDEGVDYLQPFKYSKVFPRFQDFIL